MTRKLGYKSFCGLSALAFTFVCPGSVVADFSTVEIHAPLNVSPIVAEEYTQLISRTPDQAVNSPELVVTAIGDPIFGGSWFQDFSVHAPTAFSNLGMMTLFGYAGLEGAPSMDFSHGGTAGWSQVFGPPGGATWPIAASTGVATTDLVWRAHFADPVGQPFTLMLFAYNDVGSNIFNGASAIWNGSSWSYAVPNEFQWHDFQSAVASVVPVPSGLMLGAFGLCLVAVLQWHSHRHRSKSRQPSLL